MSDDSKYNMAYSLAMSVTTCTLISSIGPLITNYYFFFTILILVSIVVAMETVTRYDIKTVLQNWGINPTKSPKKRIFKAQERARHVSCPAYVNRDSPVEDVERTRKTNRHNERRTNAAERKKAKMSIFTRSPKVENQQDNELLEE